ncbi:MAG: hypothetical protein ACXVBL_18945 [Bdellovibrionota bacterium]
MIPFLVSCCLGLGLLSAIMAITSDSTERLLWGSVLCSIGLGAAVEFVSGGYYGILIIAVFLAADLVVYLYFRTQELLPARPARNRRADWLYRLFFLWLAFCSVVAGGLAIMDLGDSMPVNSAAAPSLALLHERIWSADWLLALIPILFLLVIVTGGFFMVRRDR